jgi:hypothetical protein
VIEAEFLEPIREMSEHFEPGRLRPRARTRRRRASRGRAASSILAPGTAPPTCPPKPCEWRCIFVEEVTLAAIAPGEWHTGARHKRDNLRRQG